MSADPIGFDGGWNRFGYAYQDGINLSDQMGLKPWDWNGKGNASACSYYDNRVCETSGDLRSYYEAAGQICRGNREDVNGIMSAGIGSAWLLGNTDASEADIYNQVRNGLIAEDKAAVAKYGIGGVKGNMIDAYHNQVFRRVGIGYIFYGGNISFQGVSPNPVPFDSDGKYKLDPRRLFPTPQPTLMCSCAKN